MTRQIVEPLWLNDVDGIELRWFRCPTGDDVPWVAVADLFALTRFPREADVQFGAWMNRRWAAGAVEVLTDDGPVLIAPHWLALSLLDAGIESGSVTPESREQYVSNAWSALYWIIAPIPKEELAAWVERVRVRTEAAIGRPV
jgi:hypothetical protein